jgi:hypothetical protein
MKTAGMEKPKRYTANRVSWGRSPEQSLLDDKGWKTRKIRQLEKYFS